MALEKDTVYSWLYLGTVSMLMLTVLSVNSSTGILVAIFIKEFDESNAKAGWIASITVFLLFSLCPLVIHIYHSLGFRRSMAIAGFFYIVTFVSTSFVSSLNFMFFTYSIPFGICVCFVAQLSIRTLREYFDKFHGFAMGVRYSSVAFGASLLSFFIPMVYDELGFRNTCLSFLLFSPIFGIIAFVSRTHQCQTANSSSRNKSVREHMSIYRELIQDKTYVICLVGTATYFLTAFGPFIFMVRYGVTLGYPLSKAKWLLLIRNLTTLLARLVVGRLSDVARRHGKVKLLHWFSYPLFGLASFLCSFVRSFPLLLVYMGIIGVIQGIFWVTFSLYVDEITGGYHSDEAYSLMCFMMALTNLVGGPALGWLFDLTGDFRYVFYSISVVSLFSGFLVSISFCVKAKQEFSLVEKGRRQLDVSLSRKTVDDRSLLVYETAV